MPAWGHHVQRRSGIYHLRVRIPADLRPRLGQQELRKSLSTACPLSAKAKAASIYARVHQAFAELRMSGEQDQQALIEILRASLNQAEELVEVERRIGELKAEAAERGALTAALEVVDAQRRTLERQREALASVGIAVDELGDNVERLVDGHVFAQAQQATAALEKSSSAPGLRPS